MKMKAVKVINNQFDQLTHLHWCWRLWRRFHFNVFNDITINLGTTVPCRLNPADCGTILSDLQNLNLLTRIRLA